MKLWDTAISRFSLLSPHYFKSVRAADTAISHF